MNISTHNLKKPEAQIEAMCKRNRLPSSFLFFGERGWGKSSAALFAARTIIKKNAPANAENEARLVDENIHPDVTFAEHSGKLGGFSVETVRGIITDAYIKPNNGGAKIYIFDDADNISVQAQNALLKLIEEPPNSVYFIFTALSRTVFLPTVISRVTCIGLINPQTNLNLDGPSGVLASNFVSFIKQNDEFSALALVSKFDDKDNFFEFIKTLDDCLFANFGINSIRIHEAIKKAYSAVKTNMSLKLAGAYLCAEIFDF